MALITPKQKLNLIMYIWLLSMPQLPTTSATSTSNSCPTFHIFSIYTYIVKHIMCNCIFFCDKNWFFMYTLTTCRVDSMFYDGISLHVNKCIYTMHTCNITNIMRGSFFYQNKKEDLST